MQLVPLAPAGQPADPTRSSGALGGSARLAPSPAVAWPTAATAVATPHARATPQRGVAAWNPQLNQQVATAQQSLAYLDTLALQLQDLKSQMSLQLAGGFVQEGRLQAQRARLERLWQERPAQSGNGLNEQLQFSSDGREALPQVVQAARQVEQTRQEVQRVLADAADALGRQRAATDGADAAAFAQHFGRVGQDARYSGLSALASSLHSLPRYRIDSLLALRSDSALP